MNTFIYTTKTTKAKYPLKKTLEIYWVNNNFPTNVASCAFYMSSTRGAISEALNALACAGIVDKKYKDTYYSERDKDCDFRIIELN